MEEASFTAAPPVFNGENYQTWVVRMTVHLQALDVWEAIEEDYEISPLGANPTVAQMKNHKEKKTRKAKAKACLFSAVSPLILTRIMQLESAAEIWKHLREKYQGNERVRNMQVMNLIREFEMVRMKESQTIKDYAEQLLTIANKGHIERICRTQQQQGETNVAAEQYQEEQLFSATCFTNGSTSESWLVDSGCTNHMTYDQNLFREIDRTAISKVGIGNGEYIPVKGKGTVAIESLTGLKLISDVLFVPDIDQNLLSVGQLVEKGFKVCFEDKNCIIKDAEGREVFNIKMKGKSFALNMLEDEQIAAAQHENNTMLWHKRLGHFHHFEDKNCIIKDVEGREVFNIKMKGKSFALNMLEDEQIAAAQHENNTMLWHKRLGHFHHNAVLYMKKNQIVEGLPGLEEELPICAACQYGKQTRLPFPQKAAWKSTQKLQLVHTDVSGPQKTPSLKGSKYYIAFIDDFTRFCWIYFLTYKSEVADVFLRYKSMVENQSEYRIKVKRDKLDKKSEPGIFIGYSSTSKAYRIYLPQNNKIVVRRDVKFLETEKWSWDEQNQQYIDEDVDELPIRGFRTLFDIYQRCNIAVLEPAGFVEAAENKRWRVAMQEELNMIDKNNTWELVDRPSHKKPIGVKWVYRTKLNSDGSINKHKARLVVKGYAQMFGVDFSETFAPVARLDTIRMLLALAAQRKWKIYQLDMKSAFLNGYLEEEIFVEQPEGFAIKGKEEKVYLLKKALYGLRQAPRAWYNRIDTHLLTLGFHKSLSEFTLYIKKIEEDILIVSLYVDDLLVTGSNAGFVNKFKAEMEQVFEMTDLGEMSYFLGMEVHQKQNEIFIYQQKYAKEILKKFKMEECKSTSTPMNQKEKFCKEDGAKKVDEGLYRSMIGCLMYLTATRPDIMHAVSLLSRYMHCASEIHFQVAKLVIRYVKGTVDYGIKFSQVQSFNFHGFSDSDWAGCIDDMRSTSGYCFSFGSGVFSWSSRKQEVVAQSTTEAEYIAAVAAVNQALWLRKLLTDLDMKQEVSTKVFVDNQATISIANDPVFHGKTKHFKIKLYFLREVQKEGDIQLVYCNTESQNADILTKALPKIRFEFLRERLGVCSS
ncbi:Retrovirus-related Pol polyprotein from transposon RE1 [Vitis vinifera]|uniref:Retrovirus-related Pol polyprotein from transposon RE1 n=1 Tax=Vitis vinifera TaxID=29760 RepID=A0A438EE23_VITVI|nr:Retrovirus-related Pol polyprotein from transposon RE1 [Vitis vinifera]